MPKKLSKPITREINNIEIIRIEMHPLRKVFVADIEYGYADANGTVTQYGRVRVTKRDADYDKIVGQFLGSPDDPQSVYSQMAEALYADAEARI